MESFSLTLASGWNKLSTLLVADVTFKGKYLWGWMAIRNTHATAVMVIKGSATSQPASVSGFTLPVGGSLTWNPDDGIINGETIWINASAAGSCDITFTAVTGG